MYIRDTYRRRQPQVPGRGYLIYGFPILWGGHQFLRFCAEAFPEIDQELSLYLPYCPATPWVVPPGLSPNFNRSVKVLFQGGVRTGVRFRAIGALRHTPGARLVAIHDLARRGQYITSFGADDERLTPMREATRTRCARQAIRLRASGSIRLSDR